MLNRRLITFHLTILFFLVALSSTSSDTHFCGSDGIQQTKLQTFNESSDSGRKLQEGKYEPIRIFYDYGMLDDQADVDSETKSKIKEVFSNVKNLVESLLQVQRIQGKLRFSNCDPSVTVSNQVRTEGVNADLVIIPYVNFNLSDNILAAASACLISTFNNRPVAGYILISSKKLNFTRANWMKYYTNILIHEMAHILAFSPVLFYLYVDKENNPIPFEKIIQSKEIEGVARNFIVTPKVIEYAKRHFQCDNVFGVELENQGGSQSVNAHWESRVMLTDFMTASIFEETVISEITLALFEDSGWYKVNYYTGGLFKFGKDSGCKFLESKCVTDNQVLNHDFFCSEANTPMCLPSRTGRGYCGIFTFSNPLDQEYQYFDDPNKAGYPNADYCPVAQTYFYGSSFYSSSCSVGVAQNPDNTKETISEQSGCFISSLSLDSEKVSRRSVCYEYSCDYDLMLLTILIDGIKVKCPRKGGVVNVPEIHGNLLCPYFSFMCTSKIRCNNLTDCVVKKAEKIWIEQGVKENPWDLNAEVSAEDEEDEIVAPPVPDTPVSPPPQNYTETQDDPNVTPSQDNSTFLSNNTIAINSSTYVMTFNIWLVLILYLIY